MSGRTISVSPFKKKKICLYVKSLSHQRGENRIPFTMSPLHVLIIVRPIGKMMITFDTGIRTFSRMLSPVSL